MTPRRRALLAALLERLLPAVDGRPGAAEAGLAEYVEEALGEPRHRGSTGLVEIGLDALDTLAGEHDESGFAELAAARRDAVIELLAARPEPAAGHFLRQMVRVGLEGLLAAPRHGGNRAAAGWRAAGLEPGPHGGAQRAS